MCVCVCALKEGEERDGEEGGDRDDDRWQGGTSVLFSCSSCRHCLLFVSEAAFSSAPFRERFCRERAGEARAHFGFSSLLVAPVHHLHAATRAGGLVFS